MVDAHARQWGHMVATMEVPRAQTKSFGILDISHEQGRIAQACGMMVKPHPDRALSCDAVIGRYILEPSVFDRLGTLRPGAGGELQLTDAINGDLANAGVTGYRFDGERFDCGSVQGFVQATAAFALDRAELRTSFSSLLGHRLQPAVMEA